MRKLTTKIIGDMMMLELTKYNEKLHKLNEDFHTKSEALIAANDLIIKFPNLQISKKLNEMWTSDVNHLVDNFRIQSDRVFTGRTPVYVYPFIEIHNHRVYAAHSDYDLGFAFLIGYMTGEFLYKGIIEAEGWEQQLEKNKIPMNIILDIKKAISEFNQNK